MLQPFLGLVPKISENFDDVDESPHLSIRQTCDPKWTTLDPRHTMCLTDVGVAVPLDAATKAALVQQHNDLRSQVEPLAADMQEMAWDEDLSIVSEKWAMQCVVGHDNFTARQVPSLPRVMIGQNGGFGYSTFADAVQAWFDERKDFLYGKGSTGGVVGHYTQINVSGRIQRLYHSAGPSLLSSDVKQPVSSHPIN
ncbi:hypothetical protein C0Q70_01552 [Pomacea canaliculata]|uniref:SCP domain-containing protein n=1 Tax=Pomacea canaliculata TaxID=400727 RepID=A0A2T7PZV9_POMCA|nr:hypothetical protein C0Q70_01552 [Pomacea canaliculata]